MRYSYPFAAGLLAIALITLGCGHKSGTTPAALKLWTNASYHMAASYPDSWKTDEAATVQDAKTGASRIMLWNKPGKLPNAPVAEFPPYVKIVYTPVAKVQMPNLPLNIPNPQTQSGPADDPDTQNRVMGVPTESGGVITGWTESGGINVASKKIKIADGIEAEEGTALLKAGNLLHATYTGALTGPDEMLRVILVPGQSGAYEITVVAAPDSDSWREANEIVDSLRFTK